MVGKRSAEFRLQIIPELLCSDRYGSVGELEMTSDLGLEKGLDQCCQTRGPRAACGPPADFK